MKEIKRKSDEKKTGLLLIIGVGYIRIQYTLLCLCLEFSIIKRTWFKLMEERENALK